VEKGIENRAKVRRRSEHIYGSMVPIVTEELMAKRQDGFAKVMTLPLNQKQ